VAPYDCVFTLVAPDDWGGERAAQVALCMRDERNFYYAEFLGGAAWLGRCMDGRRSPLAGRAAIAPGRHDIAIQRRGRLLQLVCDGRRLLTAYDDRLDDGKVAMATEGGVELEGLMVQPIADIHVDDDFTRAPGETGEWEVISGRWQSSGELAERPKPELSANPFSYHVQAEIRALAAAGYDFWDSYSFRCAVRPSADGAVGLAICFQDEDNYYLLRWSRTGGAGGEPGGRLQLIKVEGGRWQVLAEEARAPYQPDVWYDLKIAAAGGCLEAYVDGHRRLQAMDDTFPRGRVALYAEACESAFFDDVHVRSHERYVEDFASPRVTEGRCRPVRGRWTVDAEHLYGSARGDGDAHIVTGKPSWEDYVLEALVKLKQARRVGLILCYQGPDDYYLVRWGTTRRGQGTRELIRVAGGEQQVLATATFRCVRNRFERIRVGCHRGHITLSVGDRLMLEATDTTFAGGQVGFYVQGPDQACFDDVSVRLREPPPPPPAITAQFTEEDTMTGWVSPEACWLTLADNKYVHDLPLFADYCIEVQLKGLAEETGRLDLYLGADEGLERGARLRASCDGGVLTAELALDGQVLATGEATSEMPSPRLVVERHGSAVIASLVDERGESVLVAHQVGAAAPGNYVGFERGGLSAGPGQIRVRSDGLLDQTFSGAATGWRPGTGIWEVHDRWPCSPGWSWFGGRDPEGDPKHPILWSKDLWTGEVVLEFWSVWSGLIMDLPAAPGYSDPSDLNCTIGGDGRDLCSGYSFVYAGDHNTCAKIMRGNDVVAETPEGHFINPISANADFHRHWFKTRVHKRGGHIEYYVDDELLLEYDDPQPLSGGGIALWSYNNGVLISRVRISAEHRAPGG